MTGGGRDPDWFEDVPVGYLETAGDGTVLRVNRTLLAWTGLDREALLGQPWTGALLPLATRVLVNTHIMPLLDAQGRVSRLVMDLLAADQRRIHVVAHVERRRSASGGEPVDRFTFVEAPDRKAWEEQVLAATRAAQDAAAELRELNERLEQRVAERTEELRSANQDLDAYARGVAHDLRGPLQAVLALASALDQGAGDALPPKAQGWLRQLIQAATSMETLISGLLQLARASGEPLNLREVDLSALGQRIREELEAAQPERRVRFTIEPGLTGWGDPGLVEGVLRNLLSNAWKYTSAHPDPAIVLERWEADGFCVRDNGAGFDQALAAKLFQPYQRLHDAQAFPGIGLGLVAVKRIIERHGGDLSVEAAPGRGAAFRFRLGPAPG